jgi:hypothetical protein
MSFNKLLASGLLAMGLAAPAAAIPISFSGSGTGPGSVPVSALATFDINAAGTMLTITLQNTSDSNSGQDVPGSTLTGLFFDLTGNPILTPTSASVALGAILGTCSNTANCGTTTDVAGEFGYQVASFGGGSDRGIASSGYLTTGLADNVGNFNVGAAGVNLDDPASLDGINFGIISAAAGYNPNGGLDMVPVIRDTVTFVLTGAAGSLLNVAISNVSFQYGTSLTELNVPGTPDRPPSRDVPEPATLVLIAAGLIGLSRRRLR